jgi:mono/diheme cytochrome c family protein
MFCTESTKLTQKRKNGSAILCVKLMNYLRSLRPRLLAGIGVAAIGAAIYSTRIAMVYAGPPQAAPEKPPEKSTLTGSQLYAINCNRCHQERYPTEFNPTQWKTIMTHMRVRANLPAAQAREILKYLLEDAGS